MMRHDGGCLLQSHESHPPPPPGMPVGDSPHSGVTGGLALKKINSN